MSKLVRFLKDPLNAGAESIGLPIEPLADIEKDLQELGFKSEGPGENSFNGWQVDFWYSYNHSKYGRWTLGGSLWYGNYKFYKDEEDTTEEEG